MQALNKRNMRRKTLVIFATLLLQCQASPPLALHQLVEVEPGGEVVLKLHGVDFDGDDVSGGKFIGFVRAVSIPMWSLF